MDRSLFFLTIFELGWLFTSNAMTHFRFSSIDRVLACISTNSGAYLFYNFYIFVIIFSTINELLKTYAITLSILSTDTLKQIQQ